MQESTEEPTQDKLDFKLMVQLVVALLTVAGVVSFVLQNGDEAPIEFLSFTGSAPLYLVMLISVVAGIILSIASGVLWRHRRGRR